LKKKGRRLKRYLGLRREKVSVHRGGIEHLMPGRLSGWVVAAGGVALQDVRLLVGQHLIARAPINQPRPDVCEALGWQGQPGFSLVLPAELPPLDWQALPRLVAFSADSSEPVELELMGRPEQTSTLLRALLRSDLLGLEGHCDGLLQGTIRGWAARPGQRQPAQIWIQAAGLDPVPVRCDQWRDGMRAMNLPERSGFSVDPKTLPAGWEGREVWFSFDRLGQFRLPQAGAVLLPAHPAMGEMVTTVRSAITNQARLTTPGYHHLSQEAPEDLRPHWEALERFRLQLDGLEEALDRRDLEEIQPSLPPRTSPHSPWWSRLLGFGSKGVLPAPKDRWPA
jgi:hypothetical protein